MSAQNKTFWSSLVGFLAHPVTSGVAIVVVFLVAIISIVTQAQRPIVEQLPDLSFTRGVITLVFVLFTIGFAAIVLIHGLFVSEIEKDDRRFTRGREVLGLFVGIVGTIIGFYFGSAEKTQGFDVAVTAHELDSKISVNAHAIGGSPPYRFTVFVGSKKTTDQPVKSDDGWLSVSVDKNENADLTVEVTDAKDLRATKTISLRSPGAADQKPKQGLGTQSNGNSNVNNSNSSPK